MSTTTPTTTETPRLAHTPKPWEADNRSGTPHIRSKDKLIGVAYPEVNPEVNPEGGWIESSVPEAEANSHLMAAAPDLLEVLEEYSLPYSDTDLERLANATTKLGEISPEAARREIHRRAAILKAKGGSV